MTRLTKQEEQLQLKHEMDDFEVIELHSFVNSSVRLPLSSSLLWLLLLLFPAQLYEAPRVGSGP